MTAGPGPRRLPRVFEGLGPEPITPVEAPDANSWRGPDIAGALDSVVHVRAESERCDTAQVGSGWVVSPGHVATNAHVVAGRETVRVSVRGTGAGATPGSSRSTPPRRRGPRRAGASRHRRLPPGAALETGDPAVLAGFPGDEGLWVGGARVRAP